MLKAKCRDMPAMLRAYEGRKLPRLTLPLSAFGASRITDLWARCEEPVEVEGQRGRIVGWAVIVEVDPPAADAPPDEIDGQEAML